jgi:hypothetical protein
MESAVQRAIAEDPHVALRMDFGCMSIVHEGCGTHDLLVVSGPERGHLWVSDPNGMCLSYAPLSGYHSSWVETYARGPERITFHHWYEQWVDASLAEVGTPGV